MKKKLLIPSLMAIFITGVSVMVFSDKLFFQKNEFVTDLPQPKNNTEDSISEILMQNDEDIEERNEPCIFDNEHLLQHRNRYLNSFVDTSSIEEYEDDDDDDIEKIDYSFLDEYQYRQLVDTSKLCGFTIIKQYVINNIVPIGIFDWRHVPTFSVAITKSLGRILPFDKRSPLRFSDSTGDDEYFLQAFQYIAGKRTELDFYNMYQHNKRWVHLLLSKKNYTENIGPQINLLIEIYEDIVNKPEIMDILADEMLKHEQLFLKSPYDTPYLGKNEGFEDNFLPVISPEIRERMTHISDVVYLYSFWLRRYYEGNIENIYNTLTNVQYDYSLMDEDE